MHAMMLITLLLVHNTVMQQAAKYPRNNCSGKRSSEYLVYDRAAPLEGGVGWTQPALPPSLLDATGSSG